MTPVSHAITPNSWSSPPPSTELMVPSTVPAYAKNLTFSHCNRNLITAQSHLKWCNHSLNNTGSWPTYKLNIKICKRTIILPRTDTLHSICVAPQLRPGGPRNWIRLPAGTGIQPRDEGGPALGNKKNMTWSWPSCATVRTCGCIPPLSCTSSCDV